MKGPKPKTSSEQLLRRLVIGHDDDCWIWPGARDSNGYGRLSVNRVNSDGLAHRASYKHFIGGIAQDIYVCHKCNNPPCCNPKHLFLGNQKDNCIWSAKTGRYGKKLTPGKVMAIREELALGETQTEIAKRYNVHQTLISLIHKDLCWAHIEGYANEP